MRVTTVATAGCLFVLMHAPGVFASDGPSRALTAFYGNVGAASASCSEPTRVRELALSISPPAGTPDSLAQAGYNLQPSELGSRVTSAEWAPARTHVPIDDAATTLWCVTAEDPRCAPLDDSGRTSLSFRGDKLGFAVAAQPAPAIGRALAAPVPPTRMDDTRDGIAGRVERPPRAR